MDLRDPAHAVASGIALIPEDRGRDGLARQLPIAYNVTAASLATELVGRSASRRRALRFEASTSPSCAFEGSSEHQLAGRLSGGNQQKVVIAKWLARGARVFCSTSRRAASTSARRWRSSR